MSPHDVYQIPKPVSALLPLPRELRDCIYEYLLTTTFYVINPRRGQTFLLLPLHRQSELAILNVSKSTYEEAKRVLLKHGHFNFSAVRHGAPPLHTEIGNIPALEVLRSITIYVNTYVGRILGHEQNDLIGFATTLVNHFAGVDSPVPRRCCVVEIDFSSVEDLLVVSSEISRHLKNALGRLAGFETVELKIGCSYKNSRTADLVVMLCDCLGELLKGVLGERERAHGDNHFRCIYRSRRV